jgi:hypothetical protein
MIHFIYILKTISIASETSKGCNSIARGNAPGKKARIEFQL